MYWGLKVNASGLIFSPLFSSVGRVKIPRSQTGKVSKSALSMEAMSKRNSPKSVVILLLTVCIRSLSVSVCAYPAKGNMQKENMMIAFFMMAKVQYLFHNAGILSN